MFDRVLEKVIVFGLGLALAVRISISGLVYPWTDYIFLVWLLFLWLCWWIRGVYGGAIALKRGRQDVLWLILLVWMVLSWFQSVNIYDGIHFAVNFITCFLFYSLMNQVIDDDWNLKILIIFFLAAATAVSFFGVYQYFYGLEETRQWVRENLPFHEFPDSFKNRLASSRVFATFIYPNAFAGFLLLALPVATSTVMMPSLGIRRRIILWSAIAGSAIFIIFEKVHWIAAVIASAILYPLVQLTAFMMTYSKGGLLVFSVMILIFLIHRGSRLFQTHRKVTLFSMFVVCVFCVLFWQSQLERLWSGGLKSLDYRFDYWKAGFGILSDHLLWGVGPGAFGSAYARYKIPWAEETRMAHNNILQIGCEMGLGMGLVILIMMVRPLWTFLRERKDFVLKDASFSLLRMGALYGLTAFFLHGLFDFDLYEPSIAMSAWFLQSIFYRKCDERVWFRFAIRKTFWKFFAILGFQALILGMVFLIQRPYWADRLFYRANELFAEKDPIGAVAVINESIQKNPFNPHAHYFKGVALETAFFYEDALKSFQRSMELDPLNPGFPFRQAVLYQKLQEKTGHSYVEEIEGLLRKTIYNYPTYPKYHWIYSRFLEKIGRRNEAKEHAERAELYQRKK